MADLIVQATLTDEWEHLKPRMFGVALLVGGVVLIRR